MTSGPTSVRLTCGCIVGTAPQRTRRPHCRVSLLRIRRRLLSFELRIRRRCCRLSCSLASMLSLELRIQCSYRLRVHFRCYCCFRGRCSAAGHRCRCWYWRRRCSSASAILRWRIGHCRAADSKSVPSRYGLGVGASFCFWCRRCCSIKLRARRRCRRHRCAFGFETDPASLLVWIRRRRWRCCCTFGALSVLGSGSGLWLSEVEARVETRKIHGALALRGAALFGYRSLKRVRVARSFPHSGKTDLRLRNHRTLVILCI